MKYLKSFEQHSSFENQKIDEGFIDFSSVSEKSWKRMNTSILASFIKDSINKSYFTYEKNLKKVKMPLNFTKENWKEWADICKTNNNVYSKIKKSIDSSNNEIVKNINIYVSERAKQNAGAKSGAGHSFGGTVKVVENEEFDAQKAVNIVFKD
jgi:hypothetical protein